MPKNNTLLEISNYGNQKSGLKQSRHLAFAGFVLGIIFGVSIVVWISLVLANSLTSTGRAWVDRL